MNTLLTLCPRGAFFACANQQFETISAKLGKHFKGNLKTFINKQAYTNNKILPVYFTSIGAARVDTSNRPGAVSAPLECKGVISFWQNMSVVPFLYLAIHI